MIGNRHFTAALMLLAFAGAASAAGVTVTERFVNDWPLNVSGTFSLENPYGNVEVVGVDAPGAHVTVVKTLTGVDKAAVDEARAATQLRVDGDERVRILRTTLPAFRNGRWSSAVHYQVRIPRTAHVKIATTSGDFIRVTNITGNVFVKNVNGGILLQRVIGAATVESSNGSIIFDPNGRPGANAQLSTTNGDIQVVVSPDSMFQWVADTIRGEFRTTLQNVRGRYTGSGYRGGVNGSGGPTLSTSTMMGNVFLLGRGTTQTAAWQVKSAERASNTPRVGPAPRNVRLPVVTTNYVYETSLGNIYVQEVQGNARVTTGAGEVQLGIVHGECDVTSLGGPLTLGDIFGQLDARTDAGDVLVTAARKGGIVNTGGGIVRVILTAGALTINSGGGDISVRQAMAPVSAETKSGDVTITVDPGMSSDHVTAKTSKGNVILNLPPRISADVEATLITSDPDANAIRTDFVGLTMKREQLPSGKTRIRATGKLNGGGQKIDLQAEDGSIEILSFTGNPLVTP